MAIRDAITRTRTCVVCGDGFTKGGNAMKYNRRKDGTYTLTGITPREMHEMCSALVDRPLTLRASDERYPGVLGAAWMAKTIDVCDSLQEQFPYAVRQGHYCNEE